VTRGPGPLAAPLVALAVLLTACAEPAVPDGAGPDGVDEPLGAEADDPDLDLLHAELGRLVASLTAARDRLVDAAGSADVDAARAAGEGAAALLVDDARFADARGDLDALLPAEDRERGDTGSGEDLLTTTLAAARDAGELGRRTTAVMRDTIAGDLGSWQRDPEGMVTLIEATAEPDAALADLEAAVLEVPGEGPRALAWALLVAGAPELDTAAAYAERGIAHLDLALDAVRDLLPADPEEP
jgi:hypothetical protein